ncbi:MAG: hypothetical protein M1368_10425 [Thaumarchaeota archaeon]|nr:hypothetical protein [Nitrososphaerota archaeon]
MKRIVIFISVLVATLISLVVLFSWYILVYQAGTANMYSTMGQMMGNQYSGANMQLMPSYVWAFLVAFLALLVIGVGGLAYYVAYPQIIQKPVPSKDYGTTSPPASPVQATPVQPPKETLSVLLRTSKPDEKRVLEVLSAHGGKHLQKLIVKESGLSKLRTHRIISRFSERGIVSVTKSGNTNEVRLSPWLDQTKQESGPNSLT